MVGQSIVSIITMRQQCPQNGPMGLGVVNHMTSKTATVDLNTWISLGVLVVALSTLFFSYPRRAKVDISRLDELDTEDLLFFVYPQPNPDNDPQIPRDYLLNLQVVVANVGGRKAVISSVSIEEFKRADGQTTYLPEGVQGAIGGSQWTLQFGFVGPGQRVFQNISSSGPYVLASDDAIVIKFRQRRGIDWSDRWDLSALRGYSEALRSPFISARVRVAWRRGREVRRDDFWVDLKVLQHDLYLRDLAEVTQNFTVRPDDVEARPIEIE